jgi:hypothetical protein
MNGRRGWRISVDGGSFRCEGIANGGCVIVKLEQRLGGGEGGHVPMDDRMKVIY